MTTKETYDLIILGRKIGTCTGWDEYETDVFGFYDVNCKLPNMPIDNKDISIDYKKGILEIWSDVEENIITYDLVSVLKDVPIYKE